jgi:hypothetical protein
MGVGQLLALLARRLQCAFDPSAGEAALPVSRERQRIAKREAADHRARALAPIMRELREAGFVTLKAMANELNKREIETAHGGRWHTSTVLRLLGRLRRTQEPMA